MEEIERGVRELIRAVLRESGIRHRSLSRAISTICYAQQPLASIQYDGPIRFTYDTGVVTATVHSSFVKVSDFIPNINQSLLASDVHVMEVQKFEIDRPDFDVRVKKLIDRHISRSNRSPSPHKHVYLSTKLFVPDIVVVPQKLLSKPKPKSWLSRLKNLFFADDVEELPIMSFDFHLQQAIIRHCSILSVELLEIEKTALALLYSGKSRNAIIAETKIITGQK